MNFNIRIYRQTTNRFSSLKKAGDWFAVAYGIPRINVSAAYANA